MSAKRVLVYGANGALGRQIVNQFKSQEWVCHRFVYLAKGVFKLLSCSICRASVYEKAKITSKTIKTFILDDYLLFFVCTKLTGNRLLLR